MSVSNGSPSAPTAILDNSVPALTSRPDVTPLLRCLAHPARLTILKVLARGETSPLEIGRELGLPVNDVKRHLRALEGAGLTSDGAGADLETYKLVQQAIHLLDVTFSSSVSRGCSGHSNGYQLPSGVPSPPLGCTLCGNRGYVVGVLDELSLSLDEARQYHARIQEMSSQVLTAHEAERKRIARELHDDTAQSLASIIVRLRLLERATDDPTVLRNVEELRELTSQALDSVRRMAMDLRPASLDDLGLVPALDAIAARFAENTGADVSVDASRLRRRLPRDVELVLYRVAQEALNNIAKYASATHAAVSLKAGRDHVTLVIQDDGIGFDKDELARPYGSGLGIFGMRERLALVSGELDVVSATGTGTQITARVPLATQRRKRRIP